VPVRTGFSGPLAGFGRRAEPRTLPSGDRGWLSCWFPSVMSCNCRMRASMSAREPVAFDADCGELVAEPPVFLYY
jgi:hypothetical protein